MSKLSSTNPALHLTGVELMGFRKSAEAGQLARVGSAKIGLSFSGQPSANFSETVGTPTGLGTQVFMNLNSQDPNGFYTVTITAPAAVTFNVSQAAVTTFGGADPTLGGVSFSGSGTNSLTLTSSSANNISQFLQGMSGSTPYFTVTTSQPGQDTITFSASDSTTGKTASRTVVVTATGGCFVSGTHIATVKGEVLVENLAAGDQLVTARGAIRPVRWVGHTDYHFNSSQTAYDCYPVRVQAGAFGRNLPCRDLLLSPGHHVFADGVLVPICTLENGVTIAREAVSQVTYWHVELDSHDVILSEGLPAESYLDTGNRASFADQAGVVVPIRPTSPDPEVVLEVWAEKACAPRADSGKRVDNLRWRLLEEAKGLGVETSADPGIELFADGQRVTGEWREDRLHVNLSAGAKTLRIVSRSALPVWSDVATSDTRRLGVNLYDLFADGNALSSEHPAFVSGFHSAESNGDNTWHWTDGDATLDVTGVRELTMKVVSMNAYPVLPVAFLEKSGVEKAA